MYAEEGGGDGEGVMIGWCLREAFCRTGAVLFVKVLVIMWGDSFGDLGFGVSTQKMGVKVDLSMVGLDWGTQTVATNYNVDIDKG